MSSYSLVPILDVYLAHIPVSSRFAGLQVGVTGNTSNGRVV